MNEMQKKCMREKVQLMFERPFYGSLIVRLQLKEWSLKEQTAKTGLVGMEGTFATDGEYLYYPEKCSFSSEEIRAVLAHETLHCALQHVFRCGNRDKTKWNIAADYAVNQILVKDGFKLPAGGLLSDKFAGMHAEKIYAKLPEAVKIKVPIDLVQPGGGKGKGKDKQGQIEVEVQSTGDKPLTQEEIKEAEAKAQELAQEWKEHLAHALEKNRGNIPADFKEFIEELLFPKISWEDVLYKYLQAAKGCTDFTAYPFDRRHIYREVFLPSMAGDSIEICVGVDTSGSISHDDLVRYFSEVRGICSIFGDYTIHMFQADCALHKYDIITSEDAMPNFVTGRGGTSFVPVFNKIKELELDDLPLVYFTDLDGEFPNKSRNNVYWAVQKVPGYHHSNPPFGTVIDIEI